MLGLVNGREVASSEPDRNVRWEIFPSEAVGGVTVYKTQSADLIAGGVAATIDIRTIRPLDYSGSDFVIRGGQVYYDGPKLPNYDPWGYRAAVEGVHKFNDTFGVAVGASYQSQKNGYTSFQGWGYNTPYNGGSPTTFNGVTTSTPYGAQTEVDKLTETRGSLSASAQWKPKNDFEFNFDVLYSEVRIDEFQDQQWYGRNGALGDYVRGGGHLVLGPRTGMKNGDNALNIQRQPGPLVALLGGRVEQFYALDTPVPVNGPRRIRIGADMG